MPKVTGLFVFPVKSMGGMAVDKVHIGSTGACKGKLMCRVYGSYLSFCSHNAPPSAGGVTWDRNWLVTREDGRFLTQRQLPK